MCEREIEIESERVRESKRRRVGQRESEKMDKKKSDE